MKNLLPLVASLFFLISLCCTSLAVAEEIKTEYFRLQLPADWKVVIPWKTDNNKLISFQNTEDTAYLSIVVGPMEKKNSTREFALALSIMMEMLEFRKTSDMKQVANACVSTYSHDGEPVIVYVASNNKEASIITISGTNLDSAKKLLRTLKPVDPELFPKKF